MGAIQTTGPHNYKLLQRDVVSKLPALNGVDLCANPEAVCQHEQLKWLAGLYYWTTVVQQDDNGVRESFKISLEKFVSSGFDSAASKTDGASFNNGTGGMVNNGAWAQTAQDNDSRSTYFEDIITALKGAGMSNDASGPGPSPTPSEETACEKCGAGHCYIESHADQCTETTDHHCPDHGVYCPAPAPSPSQQTACDKCGPGHCYVESWAVQCSETSDYHCPDHGVYCPAPAPSPSQQTACEQCGPGHCYVDSWATPCSETSDYHCPDHGVYCPAE